MNISTVFSKVILIAIVSAFITNHPIKAQEVITSGASAASSQTARLIVTRAANFGFRESVGLFIDGNQVAVLGYNESYDAPLTAGKHVVFITTDPKTYPQQLPLPLTITAQPGNTYAFTATWTESDQAGLVAN